MRALSAIEWVMGFSVVVDACTNHEPLFAIPMAIAGMLVGAWGFFSFVLLSIDSH